MTPIARAILSKFPNLYQENENENQNEEREEHILAISHPARNHEPLYTHPSANLSWRDGNETHAQDLFTNYFLNFRDVSDTISLLPLYNICLPSTMSSCGGRGKSGEVRHIVAGVSLGAHAAWLSVVHEPLIEAAAVIIGCCDFESLMRHRAAKSKRIFEEVYSQPLAELVGKLDPAALGAEEVGKRIEGKRVLVLERETDKLVPRECSADFLEKLMNVARVGGAEIDNLVYEGAGHVCTDEMVEKLAGWVKVVVDRK